MGGRRLSEAPVSSAALSGTLQTLCLGRSETTAQILTGEFHLQWRRKRVREDWWSAFMWVMMRVVRSVEDLVGEAGLGLWALDMGDMVDMVGVEM